MFLSLLDCWYLKHINCQVLDFKWSVWSKQFDPPAVVCSRLPRHLKFPSTCRYFPGCRFHSSGWSILSIPQVISAAAVDDGELSVQSCGATTETGAESPAGRLCVGLCVATILPEEGWNFGPAYLQTLTHTKHMINSCSCRANEEQASLSSALYWSPDWSHAHTWNKQ